MDRQASSQQQVGTLRSSIAWALLGLVIERPSYGYELAQRFRRVYGEALVLSNITRIYEALDALSVRSLIEELPDVEPDARHPRPRYRATERGVLAYQEWLLAQMEEERQRSRMFARQLALLEPEAALEVIDRYEQECLAQGDDPPPTQSRREDVALGLAHEEDKLALEARLSWIKYAREELRELLQQPPGKAGDE